MGGQAPQRPFFAVISRQSLTALEGRALTSWSRSVALESSRRSLTSEPPGLARSGGALCSGREV